MPVRSAPFGRLADGTPVREFTLANDTGMEAAILDYGGIVARLLVPDRRGRREDVVLGYDTLAEYVAGNTYFGATVGRYAGLIARGRFELDGVVYALPTNEGRNHLHGGMRGFDRRVWRATVSGSAAEPALDLEYISADGEEGYPGRLAVHVLYTLTALNELRLDYTARCDRSTVLNLTHHSYFNLAGHGGGDVLEHELALAARYFTPIDREMLPTGAIASVDGTPLDFTRPERIGARIAMGHEQLEFGVGYDHNWVLDGWDGTLRPAARVVERGSGRTLEVLTTEPGLQVYTGNVMPASLRGKAGCAYVRRGGLCLEAQHFYDSPNRPHFPSTVLRAGQTYRQTTVYRFGTCGL